MTTSAHDYRPSKGDQTALWLFIVAGAALTVATVIGGISRIIEVLAPGPTPVQVNLPSGTNTEVPYGTGGATLSLEIEQATMHATDIPATSVAAGVAAPLLTILVTATIAACLIALAISVLRGAIFSKRNTWLVTVATATGILGYGVIMLCNTMLANGAMARATGGELDNMVFSFELAPLILAAFAIALIGSVFVVGERMQRETEGLV